MVGLLDVDTAGRGHRIDDWANLLAHLALLELILPAPATAARYRRELEEHLVRRWPAEQLRPRVAAVLVGLATGTVPGAADALAEGHRGSPGTGRGVGWARSRAVGQVGSGAFAGVVQW